jgi:nicotinate dehydrogenase subunit B
MMKEQAKKSVSALSGNFPKIKRRNFFKLLGGGIFIYFSMWDLFELLAIPPSQPRPLPEDFNAFLLVGEDGMVSAFAGKIEMGQGPITSLAQMLADELDVRVDQVKMIMGDTDLCPWDRGTFGSMTTRFFGPPFRAAAAEARAVLLQLGSEKLGVPVKQLEVKEGVIYDTMNRSKQVSYAQLAKGKRIERFMDKPPDLKDPSEFRIMGRSYNRQDALIKVTGKAKFAGDYHMPGMLYARILRPPSHGATLKSADVSEAEKIEGARIVRDGELIAVLHEMPDRADEAIVKIKAEYSFNEKNVNDKTIFNYLLKMAPQGELINQSGNLDTGKSISKTIVESEYYNSYVAHAPIEPHTALAYMENDRMIVRGSTQTPFPAQETVARALDIPIEKVRVIPPFLGGGFGGKSAHSQMIEAARLAKLTGKPVMVAWTRGEEFFYDTFRPAAIVRITSGMDTTGKINLWDYHVYYAGQRGSDTIYDVPNAFTTVYSQGWSAPDVHPFATGAWRAPGNNTNTFARESQIDIMASKAGIDPLDFRLKNLKDEKMIEVLKTVASKFGWIPAKGPSGRGYGISCGIDAGTYVACMAEVNMDKQTGKVQVLRVASAQNMGLCINPEGTTIQVEGCITMGLGYALAEEIRFEGGKILNRNFDSYHLPRFSWVPKIDTVILDKANEPAQGGGEPPIINMGAVIANAIFDATGARLYQLPMTPERILEALKEVS